MLMRHEPWRRAMFTRALRRWLLASVDYELPCVDTAHAAAMSRCAWLIARAMRDYAMISIDVDMRR